jgi:cell division septation protein DedD
MGVFTNKSNAEVLEENYKKKGYDTFIVESQSKNSDVKFYRVLIGSFKTKREALQQTDKIRSKEKVDTIIFHE